MSKLLKGLGFLQKAELLLYEALTYSQEPHEAHLQLGLLFVDQEDLAKAKMHLKNCLYVHIAHCGPVAPRTDTPLLLLMALVAVTVTILTFMLTSAPISYTTLHLHDTHCTYTAPHQDTTVRQMW
jgi:hypothetical protein